MILCSLHRYHLPVEGHLLLPTQGDHGNVPGVIPFSHEFPTSNYYRKKYVNSGNSFSFDKDEQLSVTLTILHLNLTCKADFLCYPEIQSKVF